MGILSSQEFHIWVLHEPIFGKQMQIWTINDLLLIKHCMIKLNLSHVIYSIPSVDSCEDLNNLNVPYLIKVNIGLELYENANSTIMYLYALLTGHCIINKCYYGKTSFSSEWQQFHSTTRTLPSSQCTEHINDPRQMTLEIHVLVLDMKLASISYIQDTGPSNVCYF